MMRNWLIRIILLAVAALLPAVSPAQVNYTENFTGATTNNQWYFFGGACLTAGNQTSLTSPGYVPSCTTLRQSGNYYNTSIAPSASAPGSPGFYTINEPLVGGNTGTLPDTVSAGGALRLTNAPTVSTPGNPGPCLATVPGYTPCFDGFVLIGGVNYSDGLFEKGGIVSNFTFPLKGQGLKVSFTTETYYPGPSTPTGSGYPLFNPYGQQLYPGTASNPCSASNPCYQGSDGISFFLQDASYTPDLGDVGGSLGYTCSNGNPDPSIRTTGPATTLGYARGYDGLNGGFLGIGIDEYGDFLNPGDNTSTGIGLSPNTVGVRGPGSTAFYYLNANYAQYYPLTLTDPQRQAAVQTTCATGNVWNWSNPNAPVQVSPVIPLPNYAPIAYRTLPSSVPIANQQATVRGTVTPVTASNAGIPITYNVTLTPAGLLSVSYSYNGGAAQPIITGQNILANIPSGSLPTNVRFGFAASDAQPNTHEVMCFQAVPAVTSASSAGVNLKQTAQLETGSQVYFARYDPNTWAGSLTSQNLVTNSNGTIAISSSVNWDASCVLTGGACSSTGASGGSAQGINSPSRTILTWNGSTGVPLTFSSLSTAEQSAINTGDVGDTSTTQVYRLQYLRGDRSQEQNSQGVGLYRSRVSVLGDIIDSGPTWVGPPSQNYPVTWSDLLYFSNIFANSAPENSGPQYAAFVNAEQARINVVYAGANDGLLHGFESGSYPTPTTFNATTNDGKEVLAYMPAYVVNNIQSTSTADDYSSPQYGHHFDVDQSPGTGDLYYGGAWHTWLVGGLGAGGPAIYALDITDSANFSESNAANIVMGEWSYSATTQTANFSCASVSNSSTSAANCGNNLGNTYGIPQIRRFHNGKWGIVFGNGFGSATGDAGIYIMMINSPTGACTSSTCTLYYLSTGTSGTSNGIAYATPADLDGDHIVDYIYAGDLKGNVWRFNVTSQNIQSWAAQSTPIFTTAANQPITSKLVVAAIPSTPSTRVLIEFGTGQLSQFTNSAASTYSTSQQYLYGIWDYNLAAFDAFNSVQYGYLPITGFTAPSSTLTGTSQLQQQTITSVSATTDYRTVSSNAICWADTSGCSGNRQYGWYLALPGGYANATDANMPTSSPGAQVSPYVYEQVIYNAVLADGAFIVNTTIPSTSSYSSCLQTPTGGWTMAINPSTGGAFPKTFFNVTNSGTTVQAVDGLALSGTGSVSLVTNSAGTSLITQTILGTGTAVQVNPPAGTSGSRLTWIQKR